MSKRSETKREFKEWLRNNNVYDNFCEELKAVGYESIDGYLGSLHNMMSFPGYFVQDAFTFVDSVTQNKKNAYPYWNSVHWRWKDYISLKGIPDKSEFYES